MRERERARALDFTLNLEKNVFSWEPRNREMFGLKWRINNIGKYNYQEKC